MVAERVGVAIVDDQPEVRASLRELVDGDEGLVALGEAGDGRRALELVAAARPDVVLMDVRMPEMDGLAAARVVRERWPATRVIVLTTFDVDEYVYEALRHGASGFLLKNAAPEEILQAIHTVHAGNAMLAPEVTRRLIADVAARRGRADGDAARFQGLTARERDVVLAVARGLSNDEIAAELFLSRATVKTYLSRLFDKLAVRDRTQLVILAYESGYLDTS